MRFENLKMKEDETIAIFNAKLMDISNQVFQIGKRCSDEKLVRKTLKSLCKRFEAKVATIEETRDITTMRPDNFMDSLQAYEMNIKLERKIEDMALKVVVRRQNELQQEDADETNIMLLLNWLNKLIMQIFYRRSYNKRNTWKNQRNLQKKPKRM